MSETRPPVIERRRAGDFADELLARARAWIPQWNLTDDGGEVGRALLKVAAHISAEVAERLDRVGEKNRRNLLAWLGIGGEAARGARVPVVFKLTDSATEAVLARKPVQMQVEVDGTALVFETENDLRLVPARVAQVVAVDAAKDAIYLPPPGLSTLGPPALLPTEWRVRSFAAVGARQLQLDPPLGLAPDMILEIDGRQFRITAANDDIVTIDPPVDLEGGIAQDALARKLAAFAPFDGAARNRQSHALYLGHADLVNLEATATIEIVGAEGLSDCTWQYWGKTAESEESDWRRIDLAPEAEQQKSDDALVLLKSTTGAVEPREIAGVNARWVRATKAELSGEARPRTFDSLKLRIASGAGSEPPAMEGMANTTPLVLDTSFLPLGREPRQFDAFYLGCAEVFSKRGAEVKLGIGLADPSFAVLSSVPGGTFADRVLAGVARDGSLHLLEFEPATGALTDYLDRGPLRPPRLGGSEPSSRVDLDQKPSWRLPIWSEGDDFRVAVPAGTSVWLWRESASRASASDWHSLGEITTPAVPDVRIDALAYVDDGVDGLLFALYDGRLFVRSLAEQQTWRPIDTQDATPAPVTLTSIAAIAEAGAAPIAPGAPRLVGVSLDERLYGVAVDGLCTELLMTRAVATDSQPTAVRLVGGELVVYAISEQRDYLLAYHSTNPPVEILVEIPLDPVASGTVIGAGVAIDGPPGDLTLLASVGVDQSSHLVWWMPFDATLRGSLLHVSVPADLGPLGGMPTRLPGHVVVPGARSDVLVLSIAAAFARGRAPLGVGAMLPASAVTLAVGDLLTIESADPLVADGLYRITEPATPAAGDSFYAVALHAAATPLPGEVIAFRTTQAPLTGNATAVDEIELDVADLDTQDGDTLLIDDGSTRDLYTVITVDRSVTPATATFAPDLSVAVPPAIPVSYWRAIRTGGRVAPVLRLDLASPPTSLDASVFDTSSLLFPGASPRQRGTVVRRALGNLAASVALSSDWTVAPVPDASGVEFVINPALGDWRRQLGDSSSNPELSWEYSDGKGWWHLPVSLESTRHLKVTGEVVFRVPDDMASTDWAGRTNFWIRARLIGGDYGREIFAVSTTTSGSTSTQSVERSTKGIRPPIAVSLAVTYKIKDAVYPTYVLAEDSGSTRNQSDANRTAGADVEAFVPLAVTLRRLDSGPTGAPQIGSDPCAPACDCGDGSRGAQATADTASPDQAPSSPGSRALFIGFAGGRVDGEPVNLLLSVGQERMHDRSAPLAVAALVTGSLESIVAGDGTRALGETGLLTLAIPRAPTQTELFGRTLSWLRLTPAGAEDWKPSLAGAWLNAAWSLAAQTQTLELLGSSEGAPRMIVRVARPPLLRNTLELRVREPLGEEEVRALLDANPEAVKSNVETLAGHWVLWRQVQDPDDCEPAERVYALDEATGEIRLGDGRHGAIPPIGRDNIVAFVYRRTEPLRDAGARAQGALAAGTSLGMVTPVQSVEAAVATVAAGAGAPPDDAERVLRFGPARVRHRGRAVTLRDVEDLALQALPGLAQARCLRLGAKLRLIAVMRGADPAPARAIVRELRALLVAAASPLLADGRRLSIEGPKLRRFRIRAQLRVGSLDVAGAVGDHAKRALRVRFDPAHGGDGSGWPLGRAPDEREIAACLIDTPDLEGIERIELLEAVDGGERPWTRTLRSHELAWLEDDGVALAFALPKAIP